MYPDEVFLNYPHVFLKLPTANYPLLTEEIATSRYGPTNGLIAFRNHTIHRVYASNSPATDIVLLGHLRLKLADETSVEGEFVARMVLDEKEQKKGEERLALVKIWSDPSPFVNAFKRVGEHLKKKHGNDNEGKSETGKEE
jgi:hypothetical protein